MLKLRLAHAYAWLIVYFWILTYSTELDKMSSQETKLVRILLVGDPQCGKTSIILALVGEEFPLSVPPRAEEITIPGDVTPEKVPTHIMDFSSQEQDENALNEEIAKANVVCVVYDVTFEGALDRVVSYWLPMVKNCTAVGGTKPIILAGNKNDLPYPMETQTQKLQEVLSRFTEVETGLECSAKDMHNVSELFYFAQKAVLHPTAPLYVPTSKQLKPDCTTALQRVFKICDVDNDGILSDQELNDFQIRCFDAPLQPNALRDVKNIVKRNTTAGVENDGVTLEGFLFLNKLFIQRGRHETTWKVLRKFGYSNTLTLKDQYLQPVFSFQPGSSVELSKAGYQFLTDLFNKHDKDGDHALSPEEQEDMFSVCPDFPWDDQLIALTVETNQRGWITMNGFLAFWSLQTSVDYTYTAQFLAWVGYPLLGRGPLASALTEVRAGQRVKSVYHCQVLGERGSGKSTFVRGLVGKEQVTEGGREEEEGDEEEAVTVRSLPVAGSNVYLVLHENVYLPDPQELEDREQGGGMVAEGVAAALGQCDVACFLYDSADPVSFTSAAHLYRVVEASVSEVIPCIFVATKSDLPAVKQDCDQQPAEFCRENALPHPSSVSMSSPDALHRVYEKIAAIARDPSSNIMMRFHIPRWLKITSLGMLVGAGVAAAFYLLYRSKHLRRFVSSHSQVHW